MPHPKPCHCTRQSLLQVYVRRISVLSLIIILFYFTAWIIFTFINPNGANTIKRVESLRWTMTSHSWSDRIACRHLGICGGYSWLTSTWIFNRRATPSVPRGKHDHRHDWTDDTVQPEAWAISEVESRKIPDYIFDHAPFVYLHENEKWWPSDVADFLHHVQHTRSGHIGSEGVNLANMDELLGRNNAPDESFLESADDPEISPDWLTCAFNRPGYDGSHDRYNGTIVPSPSLRSASWLKHSQSAYSRLQRLVIGQRNLQLNTDISRKQPHINRTETDKDKQLQKGVALKSAAPAFLITVQKANETVDAFWFFFYAFNRGARVTGIQYGNHVGDWEHVLIRFKKGKPTQTFLSAHEWGSAYSFDALEKHEVHRDRPIVYAGLGSHANYATPGKHAYALPFGLLGDSCSRGSLWDPTQNLLSYVYQPTRNDSRRPFRFLASTRNPKARTSFLEYRGRWGDSKYPLGDLLGRNYRFAGEYKYLSGPTGPWDKALLRHIVCEHEDRPCELRSSRGGYVGPIKGTSEIESFGS